MKRLKDEKDNYNYNHSIDLYHKTIDEALNKITILIILLNAMQGMGKTTKALQFGNQNYDVVIYFINNDYENAQTFYNILNKNKHRHMLIPCSKTHELSPFLKGFNFYKKGPTIPKYLCALYENQFFSVIKNQFSSKNFCSSCSYNHNCKYVENKESLFNKLNEKNIEIFGCLNIILVKSYIHTNLIAKLLKRYEDMRVLIVVDEDILSIIHEELSFDKKVVINNYIVFIDNLTQINQNLNDKGIWDDIKRVLLIINNNNLNIDSDKKKQEIITLFEYLLQKYEYKSLTEWNDKVKQTIEENHKIIGKIRYNMMHELLKVLEDVYTSRKNKEYVHKIAVHDRSLQFRYSIDHTEEITQIFKEAKKVLITSSVLTKEVLIKLLPALENDIDTIPHSNDTCHFKKVWSITRGKNLKYMLKDIYGRYTIQFDGLMEDLKNFISLYQNKKILVVAFKEFINEIRRRLKKWAELNNSSNVSPARVKNIDFDYFYHTDGKNKYMEHEVLIIFGAPGIPKKAIDVVSKHILRNNPQIKNDPIKVFQVRQTLEKIYCEEQLLQVAERLRTVINRDTKILVLLTNITHEKFNNMISIPRLRRYQYKEFYDKLKTRPNFTFKEFHNIFCNMCKKIKERGMYKIMSFFETEGSISSKMVIDQRGQHKVFNTMWD